MSTKMQKNNLRKGRWWWNMMSIFALEILVSQNVLCTVFWTGVSQERLVSQVLSNKTILYIFNWLNFSVFSGPAAFCKCSQCPVSFTLSTQHAEQSGACPAALEEAGPGAEEVCVRPSCCSQLNHPGKGGAAKTEKNTVRALDLYLFLFLIHGLCVIMFESVDQSWELF